MTPCPSVNHSEGRVFAYKKGGNLVEKDAGPGKRRFRPTIALLAPSQETSLSLGAGGCEVAVKVSGLREVSPAYRVLFAASTTT
jgi:hypothetical protein